MRWMKPTKKKKRDFLHKQPKLKNRSTVKECWVGKKKKDFIIEVKNSQVRIGDLYKGKKKPKTSPPNMSNRKKKKWLTGSQQSETAFTEHSKLWLRTHRHTHEKKKENKNRVSRACFSFLRVLFFISLFLFKFPFTMASFFFALFQVLSPKRKKKKKMLRSFTEGDTPLQS